MAFLSSSIQAVQNQLVCGQVPVRLQNSRPRRVEMPISRAKISGKDALAVSRARPGPFVLRYGGFYERRRSHEHDPRPRGG